MATCLFSDFPWSVRHCLAESAPQENQADWISAALEIVDEPDPEVDEMTLFQYYEHLSASLAFPFMAYYPEPANRREESQFRCQVLELLDPSQHLGDVFDGIFCKVRKGQYELNLPLIDLHLAHDGPHRQLIDDFRCWLSPWR